MPAPKLDKKFHFNERYKGTAAHKAAFLVVKACGSVKFYSYLCDKICENLHRKHQPVLSDMLASLNNLNPISIDLNSETLREAAQTLLDALAHIHQNTYQDDIEFEDREYQEQVIFCMCHAFKFLAEVQMVERLVWQVESQSVAIIAQHNKEQELLANLNQKPMFKKI